MMKVKEIRKRVMNLQRGYQVAALVIIGMLIITSGLYATKNHTFEKIQEYIKSKTETPVSAPATSSPSTSSAPKYSSNYQPSPSSAPASVPAPAPVVVVDYARFEKELAVNPMISSIPEGANLVLKTYNFNTGERTWEKSYLLKKGSVQAGEVANPDVTIILSSKYINSITNTNFCDVVKQSKTNGDLGVWTDLSTMQLTWKFKSMFGYRECLGV
ncbi:MAG: hypothetical protein ABIH28_02215 [archaeon]